MNWHLFTPKHQMDIRMTVYMCYLFFIGSIAGVVLGVMEMSPRNNTFLIIASSLSALLFAYLIHSLFVEPEKWKH